MNQEFKVGDAVRWTGPNTPLIPKSAEGVVVKIMSRRNYPDNQYRVKFKNHRGRWMHHFMGPDYLEPALPIPDHYALIQYKNGEATVVCEGSSLDGIGDAVLSLRVKEREEQEL